MHVLAIHSPKGGAGRTISVMALASGFLNLGLNVLVADTQGTIIGQRSILHRWVQELRGDGFDATQLGYVALLDEHTVLDQLEATTGQYDIVLIDNPGELWPAHRVLLARADLIVMPATGVEAAASGAEFVASYELWDRAVGFATDFAGRAQQAAICRGFGEVSTLSGGLSRSVEVASPLLVGDFGSYARSLVCQRGEAGYAAARQALATAREVQMLAVEVLWRLDNRQLVALEKSEAGLRICA
jgi:hypothetical protein